MFQYFNVGFHVSELKQAGSHTHQDKDLDDQGISQEEHADKDDDDHPAEENVEVDYASLSERQKKLFNLRLKMVITTYKTYDVDVDVNIL